MCSSTVLGNGTAGTGACSVLIVSTGVSSALGWSSQRYLELGVGKAEYFYIEPHKVLWLPGFFISI